MSGMNWVDIFGAVSSAVTAIGVFLAWWQIRASRQLNRTQFEDTLANHYRAIVQDVPVKALLGEPLDQKEQDETLKFFYRYIDLTNEQIFLRQQGRVGPQTWENWRDGIRTLMAMPAFAEAWKIIREKPTTKFDELRRLERQGYQDDPHEWEKEPSGIPANRLPDNSPQPVPQLPGERSGSS
jgi:hypothetical protein